MDITTVFFFLAVIVGTLAITYSAAKRTSTPNDFYAAGNRLTGLQNGLAIAGDYMSAASFLGITGAIGIYGFDGFFYSLGFLVSYLVILFMVGEPMHNLGKYTVADSIIQRFDSKLLRGIIAMTNILITIFYMIAQLVGAGALIYLLLDVEYSSAVFIVGSLMTTFVLFGGMIAASWVQIIKAILLLSGTLIVCLIVLSRFDWNLMVMFDHVTNATPLGIHILHPGNQFENPFDTISLHLALILGTAGLPHILVRFFTVRDAVTARKSVRNATLMMGAFYLMTFILGFGAISFVGWEAIRAAEFGGNLTVPMLAHALGGEFLMAYISAVAFATILAVVTGLVMSASAAFAHDFYSHIIRDGRASEREQFIAAKCSSVAVGIISIMLAFGAREMNVAILVALTFAVAASANLPLILFSIYWRKFTSAGAIAGVVTGLFSSLVLVIISPNVMNPVSGLIRAEAIFPLTNPGIISIPLGFLGAWIGSLLTSNQVNHERFDSVLLQAHTGIRWNRINK